MSQKTKQGNVTRQKTVAAPLEQPATERPAFARPEVRKLGELPQLTTAFGGSFTP
jgi:hypothetical protein